MKNLSEEEKKNFFAWWKNSKRRILLPPPRRLAGRISETPFGNLEEKSNAEHHDARHRGFKENKARPVRE
jgi:hypothetical protein